MDQIAETRTARHDRLTGRRSPRTAQRAAALASARGASSLVFSGIARDSWHNLCFEFVGSELAKGQAQAATGPDGTSRNRRAFAPNSVRSREDHWSLEAWKSSPHI